MDYNVFNVPRSTTTLPALAAAFAMLLASDALANPGADGALNIAIRGECPAAPDVTGAILATLPAPHSAEELASTSEVADLGRRFEVRVNRETRVYLDPSRNCIERARIAAIFIALTLRPPQLDREDPPPVPTASLTESSVAQVPIKPVPAPASEEAMPWILRVAPVIDMPIGRSGTPVGFGAELRAGRRAGPWAATIGLGGRATSTFDFRVTTAQLSRFPMDLSVGYTRYRGNNFIEIEIGAALTPVSIRGGSDLVDPTRETRFEPGARLALRVGRQVSEFWSVTGHLGALVAPTPLRLSVAPMGPVGTTPSLWLTAGIGVGFGRTPK